MLKHFPSRSPRSLGIRHTSFGRKENIFSDTSTSIQLRRAKSKMIDENVLEMSEGDRWRAQWRLQLCRGDSFDKAEHYRCIFVLLCRAILKGPWEVKRHIWHVPRRTWILSVDLQTRTLPCELCSSYFLRILFHCYLQLVRSWNPVHKWCSCSDPFTSKQTSLLPNYYISIPPQAMLPPS